MTTVRPSEPVYVLGGFQTDFARNFTREGKNLADLLRETVCGALADAALDARDIEVAHVGNFIGELLSGQGHLGALLLEAAPELGAIPASRHEAACASGGMAVLAAMADLGAGHYDTALVLGAELMRAGPSADAAVKLGVAAHVPSETDGVRFPWPKLLDDVGEEYERRYGPQRAHLRALAANNFACARKNPLAQTRAWRLTDESFSENDAENPIVHGRLRRHDCSQVTDGGAALILASPAAAAAYAARRGLPLSALPRITGWGHATARIGLRPKLAQSEGATYVFPHVRAAIVAALSRAGVPGPEALDTIECHDCFTVMEYMILDHLGFAPPGQAYRAIASGQVLRGGRTPVNPSGGLMGVGHPVGASGVRMLLDAARQVRGAAGDCQVDGARRAATVNIGGSASTVACFVVEA